MGRPDKGDSTAAGASLALLEALTALCKGIGRENPSESRTFGGVEADGGDGSQRRGKL